MSSLLEQLSGEINQDGRAGVNKPRTVIIQTDRSKDDINGRFGFGLDKQQRISDRGLPIHSVGFVEINGPACNAGLREGDVILNINGIDSSQLFLEDLLNLLRRQVDNKIKLTVISPSFHSQELIV